MENEVGGNRLKREFKGTNLKFKVCNNLKSREIPLSKIL